MEDAAFDLKNKARASQAQDSLESFIKGLPRGTHLTAPEVYKLAAESGLRVSLSTVYRTLNNLSAQGQVQALAGEHGRRYEASDGDHEHDHLICVKCGLTIEFEDNLIRGFGKTVAERKGYDYRHSRFDILGICQQCRIQGEDHRIAVAVEAAEKVIASCETICRELDSALEQLQLRKPSRARDFMDSALSQLQKSCVDLQAALEADDTESIAEEPGNA